MDIDKKTQKENEVRVAEEYLSSLSDLNCNSKPLINMLTMLAEENIDYAPVIVNVVQNHIAKVPSEIKLPILYLIDSIIKNVKSTYVQLFSQCIVNIFCGAFETVNEKIRERMYALRQTWNEVFPSAKLYALDVKVKRLDNNWPITAEPPKPAIHVNPNFLKQLDTTTTGGDMEEIVQAKTRELLELKKRKLELELEATKKRLEEQEKQLTKATEGVVPPVAANATPAIPPAAAAAPAAVPNVGAVVPTAGQAALPGQLLTNPAIMGAHAPTTGAQMRPAGMFNPNFRHIRPQNFGQIPGTMQPTGFGVNKPKVNPVNPALLNSFRHRDPRLARQNQIHQQQQHQMQQNQERFAHNANNTRSDEVAKPDVDLTTTTYGNRSRSDSTARSSKSPTRHTSSHRSSGRSGKNSNRSSRERDRDSDREKDRDRDRRRRNDTKSSSSDRRKHDKSNDVNKKSHHNNNDYKDNELSGYKRKSSSPAGSPTKAKDSKRSSKSRHYTSSRSGNKHHSRSPSPTRSARARSNSSNYDIELQKHSSSPPTAAAKSSAAILPEKRRKLSTTLEQDAANEELNKRTQFSNAAGTAAPAVVGVGAQDLEKNANVALDEVVTSNSKLMDTDLRQLLFSPPNLPNINMSNASNFKSIKSVSVSTSTDTIQKRLMSDVFLVSDDEDDESSSNAHVGICNSNNKSELMKTSSSSSTINKCTTTNTIITNTNTTNTATTTMPTTKIPKVSFKIQKKTFNKLEKSTENLSTVSTTVCTTNDNNTIPTTANATKKISQRRESKLDEEHANGVEKFSAHKSDTLKSDEENKKRLAVISEYDDEENEDIEVEPMPKKSKTATKIDALFGTEDIDLRTMVVVPPPPPISTDVNAIENMENWNNLKAKNVSPEKQSSKKTSTLDDVRAKLAKTAKYNKLANNKANKFDGMSQRLHSLADLNMNEDTLEANDEKIRTIISQAQEMLETNAINNDQYKNLVQTVMCINESNKLKEAKRRESLNVQKHNAASSGAVSSTTTDEDRGIYDERSAARDAVLKKRIPKLQRKPSTEGSAKNIVDNASPISDGNNSCNSPLYDDKHDDEIKALLHQAPKPPRERRNKPSKWGDRVVEPTAAVSLNLNHQQQQQRQWQGNNAGHKRGLPSNAGVSNFRSSVPNPPVPPVMLRMAGAPWQLPGQSAHNLPPNNNNMPFMQNNAVVSVPPPPQPPALVNLLPNLPPKPCNSIDNPKADMVRTITIDGVAKEIRVYDKTAIVFMDLDQPREIGFQPGKRTIYIDNQEPITLQFNDDYKPFTIDGTLHRLRFGFPSRELYIDDHWYEIYFGGSPVSIPIGNRMHIIKAEGPPPQVNIGPLRCDIVVGKINLIVDAHIVVPLFLDARVQICQLGDSEHTIQFADNLLTVLLDGEPHQVEYGGLPKSFNLSGKKFFMRFGALPKGVVAGNVKIKDMIYVKTAPPASTAEELPILPSAGADVALPTTVPIIGDSVPLATDDIKPVLPAVNPAPTVLPTAALTNINIDELFQKLVSSGILGSALPVAAPIVTTGIVSKEETKPFDITENTTHVDEKVKPEKINDATTVTNNTTTTAGAEPAPQKTVEPIVPINLQKPESIKTRQAAIIATLYTGMQCSSCGVRFPPEQTMKYSQHLDWHFRQNRRERDASRKAHFRKWYYDLSDWVQYEEIEDLDEREKNFFEAQQSGDVDTFDDISNQRSTNSPMPSCAAGPDDVDRKCDMCHEKFEQFYNEELEEWHLRCARRVEDKIYHPLCYEDYKASLNPPKVEEKKPKDESLITDDDNAVDIEIKAENVSNIDDDGDEVKASVTINDVDDDDDDDDVIVLPNEEPSVTEIVDDDDEDEYVPANVTREEMGHTDEMPNEEKPAEENANQPPTANESMELDVEIQEPHIPFTDLDTYVEKELPEADENSQLSFLNVKIKEEPKDNDEEEDDGFEDVGTVLIQPDEEISLHSSETQTQTIISLNSANSPHSLLERPASTTSQQNDSETMAAVSTNPGTEIETANNTVEGNEKTPLVSASTESTTAAADSATSAATTTSSNTVTTSNADLNSSINADFETEITEHNLSAADPAPLPIPLASLVNKIKINITKNNVTNSHNNNSTTNGSLHTTNSTTNNTATITTTTGTNSSTTSSQSVSNISQISSIGSTIPVLCSSGSTMNKFPTSNMAMSLPSANVHNNNTNSNNSHHNSVLIGSSAASSNRHATSTTLTTQTVSNVSTISVIGSSYGNSGGSHHAMLNPMMRMQPNVIKPIQPQQTTNTQQPITTSTSASLASSTLTPIRPAKTPTPPVEDTITYEVKPALKQAQLKKMKKIERGIETSGLCSIM